MSLDPKRCYENSCDIARPGVKLAKMIYSVKPQDFYAEADVVACFLEHEGTFLMLLRQDEKPSGGRWGLPAGKVDQGEEIQKALQRELLEETGIEVPPSALVFNQTVYVRYEGCVFNYHMFSSQFTIKPRVLLNAPEHKDYRWVKPHESLELPLVHDQADCTRLFYGV